MGPLQHRLVWQRREKVRFMKVLLVEDETALADILARNLRARGFDVKAVDTAEGAILSMAEEWPEGLVLDINLPDDTGWEVLRRLGPESLNHLHVVVISAAPISQKRIAEFQPAHSFVKPFPIDALVRALSDVDDFAPNGREGDTV
jgi:DNA-binding response OmpR family regulator